MSEAGIQGEKEAGGIRVRGGRRAATDGMQRAGPVARHPWPRAHPLAQRHPTDDVRGRC